MKPISKLRLKYIFYASLSIISLSTCIYYNFIPFGFGTYDSTGNHAWEYADDGRLIDVAVIIIWMIAIGMTLDNCDELLKTFGFYNKLIQAKKKPKKKK